MNQQPSNFDFEESSNGFKPPHMETLSQDNSDNIPTASILARKKQLQRIILVLTAIGLGLGLFLSIAVVMVLNKLGLTTKPYQLKQQQQKSIEQIRY